MEAVKGGSEPDTMPGASGLAVQDVELGLVSHAVRVRGSQN